MFGGTNGGTFVINGAERVIVSQIVRSPGMYYGDTVDKADQHIYSATVIPYRGAWLEYETDLQNCFYVRIDKNRKLPITCLIRALGVDTDAQIVELFGESAAPCHGQERLARRHRGRGAQGFAYPLRHREAQPGGNRGVCQRTHRV